MIAGEALGGAPVAGSMAARAVLGCMTASSAGSMRAMMIAPLRSVCCRNIWFPLFPVRAHAYHDECLSGRAPAAPSRHRDLRLERHLRVVQQLQESRDLLVAGGAGF